MFARRFISFAAMLLVLAGCNRGSQPEMVGKPAPQFTVQDTERTVALSDFRGKVVVLNFWATWCPPCVEEVPSLVRMQQQMRGKVTVVAVGVDASEAAYNKFVADNKMVPTLLTVRDPAQKSNSLYGTFGYPETYIIDREGML